MAQASFVLEDEMEDWVEGRLYPGQKKSMWYRYAVETTLIADGMMDEVYERHQYDERQELIEAAVREKVDEIKDDPHRGNG